MHKEEKVYFIRMRKTNQLKMMMKKKITMQKIEINKIKINKIILKINLIIKKI